MKSPSSVVRSRQIDITAAQPLQEICSGNPCICVCSSAVAAIGCVPSDLGELATMPDVCRTGGLQMPAAA